MKNIYNPIVYIPIIIIVVIIVIGLLRHRKTAAAPPINNTGTTGTNTGPAGSPRSTNL